MLISEIDNVVRKVYLRLPYGTRQLHVCRTMIIPTGEVCTEIVDYIPQRKGTPEDPRYGSGALFPTDDIPAVVNALLEVWKDR